LSRSSTTPPMKRNILSPTNVPHGNAGSPYKMLTGVGGIAAACFSPSKATTRLAATRAGPAGCSDVRDYCKLHIVSHYVAVLLGAEPSGDPFRVFPIGRVRQRRNWCATARRDAPCRDGHSLCEVRGAASHPSQRLFPVSRRVRAGTSRPLFRGLNLDRRRYRASPR